MVIAGALGHAKEVFGVLAELEQTEGICFYDDVTPDIPSVVLGGYRVLRTEEELKSHFRDDRRYILGVGPPKARRILDKKMSAAGGELISIVSPFARVGTIQVSLGEGLNIMTGAVITQDIKIGKGTLVHINATIHHDCIIGEFCEISPGAHILGRVKLGDDVSVGSGAVILPGVTVGNGAIIGANATVTKNIANGIKVAGSPAQPLT